MRESRIGFAGEYVPVITEEEAKNANIKYRTPCPYCKNGIYWMFCPKHGGWSLCKHQRDPISCKLCNGNHMCKHSLTTRNCKECREQTTLVLKDNNA